MVVTSNRASRCHGALSRLEAAVGADDRVKHLVITFWLIHFTMPASKFDHHAADGGA